MKKISLLLLLALTAFTASAKGYKITLDMGGMRDSTVMLAFYSGEDRYAIDTAVFNEKGQAVFASDKPLDAGMYLVVLDRTAIFDLLISDEDTQTFSINIDKGQLLSEPTFTGSDENAAFMSYLTYKSEIVKEQADIKTRLTVTTDEHRQDSLMQKEKQLRKQLSHYSDSVAARYKGKMVSVVLNALNVPEPTVPDFPEDTPNRDSLIFVSYYSYAKDHFFDRMDLSDDRLSRTPFFEPMMYYYLDNVLLYQQADSIIPYVENILDKSFVNKKMYRYVLSNLFNHYMNSKVMGQEAAVVYLAENHYLSDKVDWESESFLLNIKDYVNRTKPTLLGVQAPELMMETLTLGQYENLYSITAPFLIVYFYEPSCGYCKTETPKVYKVFEKFKDKGVQVFAVYTQFSREEWSGYVESQGLYWINVWDPLNSNDYREKYNTYVTPQIYLLDRDKKVVGRRLDSENLDRLLTNLTQGI